jgi:hypothetical protein
MNFGPIISLFGFLIFFSNLFVAKFNYKFGLSMESFVDIYTLVQYFALLLLFIGIILTAKNSDLSKGKKIYSGSPHKLHFNRGF